MWRTGHYAPCVVAMPQGSQLLDKTFHLIWSLMDINIPRSPEISLFQRLASDIPKWLIQYILLVPRITIMMCWKLTVLHMDYVKHKLNWIMINGNLTCTLHNNIAKYLKTWGP